MKERRTYDISLTVRAGMITWPDDPGFSRSHYATFEETGAYQASVFTIGAHTGTHVDAPGHFVRGGDTVETIPLDALIGEAVVVQVDARDEITRPDLEPLELDAPRVLLKTRNSGLYRRGEFTSDYVYLAPDAAEYLLEKGVKLVGIDYLSVGEFHKGADVHRMLLERGVALLETVDLSEVPPGRYELLCLPLKVEGADGAPARAVLREL